MTISGQILVVEDETVLRRSLATYLAAIGPDVTQASSLSEANASLRSRHFDLVLLDVGLPDGDGLSLVPRIGQDRTLVMTANPEAAYARLAEPANLLAKPLDLAVLAQRVREMLVGHERARSITPANASVEPQRSRPAHSTRPPRVALYGHDSMGLGHTRRNLRIARALTESTLNAEVLVVSGARETGIFEMPPGADSLILPAISKAADGTYHSRSWHTSLARITHVRAELLRAGLKAFAPDVMIVDQVPRGANGELEPALSELATMGTRCVLGLRDVIDSPEAVRAQWTERREFDAMRQWYPETWIYGEQRIYDAVSAYGFPEDLARRASFLGYLDPTARTSADSVDEAGGAPFDLCLVGGGLDGSALSAAFLAAPGPAEYDRVVVTGPYMPKLEAEALPRRHAGGGEVRVLRFVEGISRMAAKARRVVSMGGFNTVTELLALGRRPLIVPRVRPRKEQWLRAVALSDHGLVGVLHPSELSPERLGRWLADPWEDEKTGAGLDFRGLDRLVDRVRTNLLRRPLCAGS